MLNFNIIHVIFRQELNNLSFLILTNFVELSGKLVIIIFLFKDKIFLLTNMIFVIRYLIINSSKMQFYEKRVDNFFFFPRELTSTWEILWRIHLLVDFYITNFLLFFGSFGGGCIKKKKKNQGPADRRPPTTRQFYTYYCWLLVLDFRHFDTSLLFSNS